MSSESLKKCNNCKIEKHHSFFYPKRGKCKDCTKLYNKEYNNKKKIPESELKTKETLQINDSKKCIECLEEKDNFYFSDKRNKCKECTKKSRMCEHGKRKDSCKECGTGVCRHLLQNNSCIECYTGQKCTHGNIKNRCHECIKCVHHKEKRNCIDCKGNNACVHGKSKKSRCTECEDVEMCPHKVS
jgi:hypothetical protein